MKQTNNITLSDEGIRTSLDALQTLIKDLEDRMIKLETTVREVRNRFL